MLLEPYGGKELGRITSGAPRDVALALTGRPLYGYALVFALEIVGLMLAVYLFRTISVTRFREDAELRLSDVLALSGD